MKHFLFAGAALLLTAASVAPAMAEGPRASSENHWPGMQSYQTQYLERAPQYAHGSAPHYVLEEGYDHGGKWRSHWELVQ